MNTPASLLNRRAFLKASGIALALPALESLAPRVAQAAAAPKAQRLACAESYLGYFTPAYFPKFAEAITRPRRC